MSVATPRWTRLVWTMRILLIVIVLVDLFLSLMDGLTPIEVHLPLMLLSTVAPIAAVFRPAWGWFFTCLLIVVEHLLGDYGYSLMCLIVLGIVLGVTATRLTGIIHIATLLGLIAGTSLSHHPLSCFFKTGFFVVSLLIGLGVRWLRKRAIQGNLDVVELRHSLAAIRRDERQALGEELGSLLVEALSTNAKLLTDVPTQPTTADLRSLLNVVAQRARSSLAQLRSLVSTLRGPHASRANERCPNTSLHDAVEQFEDELVALGYLVELELTPLDLSGVNNPFVTRILDETAVHVRRNMAPGATCVLELSVTDANVTLQLSYPTVQSSATPTTALRTLREEVEAQGGSLEVGIADDRWTLTLVVPHDSNVPASPPSEPLASESTATSFLIPIYVGALTLLGALAAAQVLPTWEQYGWQAASGVLVYVLLSLGLLVLLRWPTVGMAIVVAAFVLGIGATQPTSLSHAPVLVALLVLNAVAFTWRPTWIPLWLLISLLGSTIWLRSTPDFFFTLLHLVTILAGAAIGLVAHHFLFTRREQLASMQTLEAERKTARAQERRQLAGELHDIIAHQLSQMNLIVMAHGTSDDIAELRLAIARLTELNTGAQADVSTLVRLMAQERDEDGVLTTTDQCLLSAPTRITASVADTLREAGFSVALRIDPTIDQVDATARRTLVRVLRESATNILRYASCDSDVLIEVRDEGSVLGVLVKSVLNPEPQSSPDSTGWGLIGLAERLALTGGRLDAGPAGNYWCVETSIPRELHHDVDD